MNTIVSVEWLHQNLDNPNLVILDAHMETGANGKKFEKPDKTIPNARRFDLKNIFLDKTSPFPNTIPKAQEFELGCRKLGINRNSEIVVFDHHGIYSSPRVWWLFNSMGHSQIAVLDGGLPNWINRGFQTEKKHLELFEFGNFKVNFDRTLLVDYKQVVDNINHQEFLIVDARSEDRFRGTGKEPRKHLKSGKIQNSVNIPYQEVLQNGKYKPKNELNKLFQERCYGEKKLVFSCGSGLTACIVMLASQIGYANSPIVYDGSWTEWAELNNLKNVVK